ncbi:MAG: ABC transporter ATP-binding protein [SAR324 cluster bacterium]|nr:ABC transporter ATP-binding protein [SAR324 cluster bacterium]MCH8886996.1 ABC transporter ATP-binding protein [SAR324 cluster bacterium]
MALLEAQGLNKSFGSVVAANNITVAIEEREVIGVIGANGAGKTTFVNMITGYMKPTSGKIVYQGREITHLPPRQITRIGICRSFQVPQVFMTMTVFDNLLIALGVAEQGALSSWRPLRRPNLMKAADEIIEQYSIGDYRDLEAGMLPQGVRKLLDIGMAMAHKPKVILLDEPTSGVSVSEKFGIMDVVMGVLKDAGVTVVFIEHDMEIIERYSKRVLAFADGTILADGAPEAVLKDDQVRKLVIGEAVPGAPSETGGGADA